MEIEDKDLNTIHEKITLKKELYIPIDMVIKSLGLNMKKEDIISVYHKHDLSVDVSEDLEFPVAGIIIGTRDGNVDLTRSKEKPDNDEPVEEIEAKNRRNNLKLLAKRKEE